MTEGYLVHTTTIAIIAFDNVNPFLLSVPCSVFGVNRLDMDKPRFRIRVCAAEDGELRTSVGFSIMTECNLSDLTDADIVIVPSWRDADEIPPRNLLTALRCGKHTAGARPLSVCVWGRLCWRQPACFPDGLQPPIGC